MSSEKYCVLCNAYGVKFKTVNVFRLILLIIAMLGLTGCADWLPAREATPTPLPVVQESAAGNVAAEGMVVPARSVTLRAGQGGAIAEIPAAEGDSVAAGALLVAFDAKDAEVAIQQAEAGLAMARAALSAAEAGARPEQIDALEAHLASAEARIDQAAAQREAERLGSEADRLDAQAAAMEAELNHFRADEAHDETMTCYEATLPDGSTEEFCPALGTFEEIARFQMEAAYAAMVAARAQRDATPGLSQAEVGAAQADVQSAIAHRDAITAQLALAEAGPRAEEIAAAEAGVRRATAAVSQARTLLDLSRVEAPFAGALTDLPVSVGDTVAAGAPVATLATLDELRIQTKDLSELDIAQVAVGQAVIITMDARPDQPLVGRVHRIDPQGVSYLGDVAYPVLITLDQPAPDWLRWGMTAQIEIEK